ncbi:hypothetical protein AGMMS49960_12790 [Betaproteobacteria bacterium]|nr:hypothetical protein AGMMS49543_11880 [Betaproteobacteria bacterium]GHU01819.1 hypothetical protein AGMMS49960_12790 [Betaproteobacteria bacterium]GHU21422.1 hypothetical protein AGMMS50243_19110 [Betaproteobacteria bacterium]
MDQRITRQFAPPLLVGDGSVWQFQCVEFPAVYSRKKECLNITQRRIYPDQPERSSYTVLPFNIEPGSFFNTPPYASIASPSGTWLMGPSIYLIRPDGKVIDGPRDRVSGHSINAVALADGSVMKFERYSNQVIVARIWLDNDGFIRSESLPPVPNSSQMYGLNAVHIGGGQVLVVTGGIYPRLTLLYDPAAKDWLTLPGMLMPRARPALIRLPDGRIWATGGEGRIFQGGSPREHGPALSVSTTSEFWDPEQRVWQRGPDLPVPMQDHQAIWVADEATVLLGTGLFPVLLAWKPGDKAVRIAAQMGIERRSGALVPLPGRRVGVVSGITARLGTDEAWGRRSPGASVMTWTAAPASSRSGTWQIVKEGGLAVRGNRLLAVGGMLGHHHTGSVEHEVSRLAELWQGASAQTVSLPALPFDTRKAEVAWVGEQHALIHTADSLALLDLNTQDYRLLDPTALAHVVDNPYFKVDNARLVGADSQRAWFVDDNATVYWLDVDSGQITKGPRLQRQRQNFIGRVLADGRVIIAGGTVESEIVARRPANCLDCAPSYSGWGPYLAARRHDIYDPVRNDWHSSAPARAAGGKFAILASGQVVKVGP